MNKSIKKSDSLHSQIKYSNVNIAMLGTVAIRETSVHS